LQQQVKQKMLLLLPLIRSLKDISPLDFIGIKKSLEQNEALPLLNVWSILNQCGVTETNGRIVSNEILSDFMTLSGASSQDRQAFVEALPSLDPLRRFHDVVLSNPCDNSQALLDAIARRLGRNAPTEIRKEPTFEERLLAAFEQHGDFSNGELSKPSLSAAPYRILWTWRGDLAEGFEDYFTDDQKAQRTTYRLVSEGRFDELEKIHEARSLPAFKAWHRMSQSSAPPIIKSHVFLHLGKKTLRWSFYSTTKTAPGEKSLLFEKIKIALENSSQRLSGNWVIAGPPSHNNLSISRNFARNSLDEPSFFTHHTFNAWQECRALIQSIGKPETEM
jgi:hypothetical protein